MAVASVVNRMKRKEGIFAKCPTSLSSNLSTNKQDAGGHLLAVLDVIVAEELDEQLLLDCDAEVRSAQPSRAF